MHDAVELGLDVVQRLGAQGVELFDRHHPAGAQHPDPGRDPLDLAEHVRAEQHRAALRHVLREEGVELPLHERVETARGLVEHEQLGSDHQREQEGQLLAVAARELASRLAQVEVEPLRQRTGAGRPTDPVEVTDVVDVVLPGEPRVERDVARDVADPPMQLVTARPGIEPEQLDAARRGPGEPHDDPQRRRLAGAVGPEVAEDLAVLDDEVDATQGLGRTEPLRDAFTADDRDAHTSTVAVGTASRQGRKT